LGNEFNRILFEEKLYQAVNENSWPFTKAFFSISEIPNSLTRGAIIKIVKD